MAIAFGGYAVQNLGREFSPELFKLTRKLHVRFAHPSPGMVDFHPAITEDDACAQS